MTNGTSYKLLMARIVTLIVVEDTYYIIFFSNSIITSFYNLSTYGSQKNRLFQIPNSVSVGAY